MRLKNSVFFISCILQLLLIILTIMFNTDIWLFLGLSVWMWAVLLFSSRIYDNVEIVAFLCCFFIFTLGGQITSEFLGYNYSAVFSEEVETHTNILLLSSVVFLVIGYCFAKTLHPQKSIESNVSNNNNYNYVLTVRKISKVAFFITSIFWYMLLIEKISYYNSFGYYALYSDYSSKLPRIIRTLQNFAPIAFYIFLGTNPTKKEASIPLAVYFLYSAMSLLTGRRIYVAIGSIILVTYFVIRDHYSDERWITRRMKVFALLLLPVFIVFMQIYGAVRTGSSIMSTSILQTIADFFGGQGVTVNVIKYGYQYDGQLGDNKFYSLYSTIRFLRVSPLTRWMMPTYNFEYGAYTTQAALNGNSFANAVTYKVMPTLFLSGGGLGSCYVAELFYDFSYLGVCLGNAIYGYLLFVLSQKRNKGILSTAISFVILESMLKTPRYNYDLVISDLMMTSNWVFILFVFVLARYMCKTYKTSKAQYNSLQGSIAKVNM